MSLNGLIGHKKWIKYVKMIFFKMRREIDWLNIRQLGMAENLPHSLVAINGYVVDSKSLALGSLLYVGTHPDRNPLLTLP